MLLITGANGFIGSHLVEHFANKGFHVRAMRRPKSLCFKKSIEKNPLVQWVEGDLFDVNFLENSLTGCSHVIHAAAMVSMAKKNEGIMRKVNVIGTENLVNIALEKPIQKFLHISSIAALGDPPLGISNINEKQKFEKSTNYYGQTKYEAELEVWRGAAEGLPIAVVNPSFVLGFGDWTRSSLQIFKLVQQNRGLFYPKGDLNYVDINDLVLACDKILMSEQTEERYIINAGSISYRNLLENIASRFGANPPKYELKLWLGHTAAFLDGLRSKILGIEPTITTDTLLSTQNRYFYENNKFSETFNFEFRSLESSLDVICESYLRWLKS